MTGLDPCRAAAFFRTDAFVSARKTTVESGIQALVPHHVIDDYVFDPCGYSMNGAHEAQYSTIHITPEDGFSYASFELYGFSPAHVDVAALVAKVADVFRPAQLSVSVAVDAPTPCLGFGAAFAAPADYACNSASYQVRGLGGAATLWMLLCSFMRALHSLHSLAVL